MGEIWWWWGDIIFKITSRRYKMQLCKMMISENRISDVCIGGILTSNKEPTGLGTRAYCTQDSGALTPPLAGEVAQLT